MPKRKTHAEQIRWGIAHDEPARVAGFALKSLFYNVNDQAELHALLLDPKIMSLVRLWARYADKGAYTTRQDTGVEEEEDEGPPVDLSTLLAALLSEEK